MSTPNPLIPQGTFQAQAAGGASNVRIAVATIVAIHVVFFGGLLLQGCKRDNQVGQQTNDPATNAEPSTNLSLPPLESSSLYYTSSNSLPAESSATLGTTATPSASGLTSPTGPTGVGATSPDAMWQTTNLSSSSLQTGVQPSGSSASGPMKEYTVARGDSFSRIAVRNRTTVAALRAANPEVDPVRIKPGDKIYIPESAPQTLSSASPASAVSATDSGNTYTVKAGDSLTKIAREHRTTISQLRSVNNLRTSQIRVGQKLKIPAPAAPTQASTNSGL